MSSDAPITLFYFDGRGLAEVSRTALIAAGVPFSDKRYTVTKTESGKFEKPEMDIDQAAGMFNANLGRLPMLHHGDVQIGGSKAILRYICNNFGLVGSNAAEAGKIDCICEIVNDCQEAFGKAEDKDTWFSTEATEQGKRGLYWFVSGLNGLVGEDGFAVGGKVSMADCVIFRFFGEACQTAGLFGKPLSEPMDNLQKTSDSLAKWAPNLAKIVRTFRENPAVDAYLSSRGPQQF